MAFFVLTATTVIIAINTFDVFSTFYLIADEFHQDLSLLGLIAAAMTAGIGVFQIPGGILAAKYGSRAVVLVGATTVGLAAILTSISQNVSEIVILRFILGCGLACYLPAAMILITSQVRKESHAFSMGAIGAANAAGGIFGLVLWSILAQDFGWRPSIAIGGIAALIATLSLAIILPNKTTTPVATTIPAATLPQATSSFVVKVKDIKQLFFDKTLIAIGLMLLGSQAIFEQTLGFMPFYLHSELQIEPTFAGMIGSIALITALIGAPVAGLLADRKMNFSFLVLLFGGILFVGAIVNAALNLSAAIISVVLVGLGGAGLFTLFSNAARLRSLDPAANRRPEFSTLSVNWVHAIALTGTLWSPLVFSTSAINYGYHVAWVLIGVCSISFITITLLAGYRRKEKRLSRANLLDDNNL